VSLSTTKTTTRTDFDPSSKKQRARKARKIAIIDRAKAGRTENRKKRAPKRITKTRPQKSNRRKKAKTRMTRD